MTKNICSSRRLPNPAVWVLVLVLYMTPLKRARAEERLDFKTMLYQEDDDRMRIIAPTFLYEHDLSPTLTIKLEGIYNSISGASPTGAPATPNAAAPVSSRDARTVGRFGSRAVTPAAFWTMTTGTRSRTAC